MAEASLSPPETDGMKSTPDRESIRIGLDGEKCGLKQFSNSQGEFWLAGPMDWGSGTAAADTNQRNALRDIVECRSPVIL